MSKMGVMLAVVTVLEGGLTAIPATAQPDPNDARFRIGSFAINPEIRLTNVGYDSNIFNEAEQPRNDRTVTFSPSALVRYRTPRVSVSARSQFDMYYYHELTALRDIDSQLVGRLDVSANRVRPWVSGSLETTRQRQNVEIDAIAQRRIDDLRVGTAIQLTRKTEVNAFVGRSHVDFDPETFFGDTAGDTDLARTLNRRSAAAAAEVRYQVTPLTTIGFLTERSRDRFEIATERDSDSVRLLPFVEFRPLALVSGRAAIGVRRMRFQDSTQPAFTGAIASVDLQYTLRGRTRISFFAQRDLEYSYVPTQLDYVLAGLGTTVAHRLGERWEATSTLGRYSLGYRRRPGTLPSADLPTSESVLNVAAGIGYYFGRSRIGFGLDHFGRESDVTAGRGYDRLRVGSSLTYSF